MPPTRTFSSLVVLALCWACPLDATAVSAGSVSRPVFRCGGVVVEVADTKEESTNALVGLVGYLKDSIVRCVTGCGELWTNHGKCNEIRKKQKLHREALKQSWEEEGLYANETPKQVNQRLKGIVGGITYEEFCFLETGQQDRGKLMNLAFLVWGAPKFLPYALMFNPEMLPSPLQEAKSLEQETARISRERSHAVISSLMKMEQKVAEGLPGGLFSFFGKQKKEHQHSILERATAETQLVFQKNPMPTPPNARPHALSVLAKAAPYLYSDTEITKSEQRLVHLPNIIIQTVNRIVSAKPPGILATVTPNFFTRGNLIRHIEKVTASDTFLKTYNLTTISKSHLQEACQLRCMDPTALSADDLRNALSEWLDLSESQQPEKHYNSNLARMVLLTYNGCASVRGAKSRLPQLLFTGGQQIDEAPKTKRGRRRKQDSK